MILLQPTFADFGYTSVVLLKDLCVRQEEGRSERCNYKLATECDYLLRRYVQAIYKNYTETLVCTCATSMTLAMLMKGTQRVLRCVQHVM